jgi:hypothetical protein
VCARYGNKIAARVMGDTTQKGSGRRQTITNDTHESGLPMSSEREKKHQGNTYVFPDNCSML